ncbi:E3 SUMO-protein ligase ZNF451 [Rhinophrynus dorsalis]
MPGPKPGVVSSSRRPVLQSNEQHMKTQPITCPIMHCNRSFDNAQLLFGHLKRFDHSPCDPAITLHGAPVNSYACVICLQRFVTLNEYKDHASTKAKLADGHNKRLPPQVIQCFACPNCFLLFNLRDECLKHMSGTNHFVQAIKFGGEKGTACPIPFPSYAKKVLIGLCKDIPFRVLCTSCRHELRSHMELTAHFRRQCRNAGPLALSEKSIAEVTAVFQLKAYCPTCRKTLQNESHIAKHAQRTNHKVKIITTIEESILAFCYLNEGTNTPADLCLSAANSRLKPSMLKRTFSDRHKRSIDCKKEFEETLNGFPIKSENDKLGTFGNTVTAWFCQCSQKFVTEKDAEKHILASNRICHKCMVCGKLAEELSIIHLHMSRFHGGAHLKNFLYWCRACSVEMPRMEDMMAHVCECHSGHSYYFEQEALDEQPSTSNQRQSPSNMLNPESTNEPSAGQWQCHICEEMFDSEDSVQQHCRYLSTHQFHKYSCNICKKHFHKLETLLRHSQLQHDGDIKMKYFCGLCDDLYFEEEQDFQSHYEGVHSSEYGFVPDQIQSPVKNSENPLSSIAADQDLLTCGCLENYTSKTRRKEDASRCLTSLLAKGNLWYSCCFCSATGQTLEGFKSHICKDNKQPPHKDFVIKCSFCSKSFVDSESAQQHYHSKHCFLQKPKITNHLETLESKTDIFTFTASGACVQTKCAKSGVSHVGRLTNKGLSDTSRMDVSESVSPPVENKSANEETAVQVMDTGEEESELPDLDFLQTMTHIVFVNFDNWEDFFSHLPGYLNQGTFIWGFRGRQNNWKPPVNCKVFRYLSNTGSFFLHPHCSDRKDAANLAICMHAGRLNEQLPKQIPFTILSSDGGFLELESQFKKTERTAQILNSQEVEGEMMCALLNSISDTSQDPDDCSLEIDAMELDEDASFREAVRRSLKEM